MCVRLKDWSQPFSRIKIKFLFSTVNAGQSQNDCLKLTVLEPENLSPATALRKSESSTHLRERLPRTMIRRALTVGHLTGDNFFLQLTLGCPTHRPSSTPVPLQVRSCTVRGYLLPAGGCAAPTQPRTAGQECRGRESQGHSQPKSDENWGHPQ